MPQYDVGDFVEVKHPENGQKKFGEIKYRGVVKFAKGVWYGLEMNTTGGHNGAVNETAYFVCLKKRGLFVQLSHIVRKLNRMKSRKKGPESYQSVSLTKKFAVGSKVKFVQNDGKIQVAEIDRWLGLEYRVVWEGEDGLEDFCWLPQDSMVLHAMPREGRGLNEQNAFAPRTRRQNATQTENQLREIAQIKAKLARMQAKDVADKPPSRRITISAKIETREDSFDRPAAPDAHHARRNHRDPLLVKALKRDHIIPTREASFNTWRSREDEGDCRRELLMRRHGSSQFVNLRLEEGPRNPLSIASESQPSTVVDLTLMQESQPPTDWLGSGMYPAAPTRPLLARIVSDEGAGAAERAAEEKQAERYERQPPSPHRGPITSPFQLHTLQELSQHGYLTSAELRRATLILNNEHEFGLAPEQMATTRRRNKRNLAVRRAKPRSLSMEVPIVDLTKDPVELPDIPPGSPTATDEQPVVLSGDMTPLHMGNPLLPDNYEQLSEEEQYESNDEGLEGDVSQPPSNPAVLPFTAGQRIEALRGDRWEPCTVRSAGPLEVQWDDGSMSAVQTGATRLPYKAARDEIVDARHSSGVWRQARVVDSLANGRYRIRWTLGGEVEDVTHVRSTKAKNSLMTETLNTLRAVEAAREEAASTIMSAVLATQN